MHLAVRASARNKKPTDKMQKMAGKLPTLAADFPAEEKEADPIQACKERPAFIELDDY